ncbi:MAG: hypothetical protein EXS64_14520 [Candidatus Latescibacteria bacterium]|nr:hypothetical protein [Candidatus Latescibacterota bacterium]
MAWTKRQRGSRYYVRSERHGDKVITRYYGTGPIGIAVAAVFEERDARRKAESEQREGIEAVERNMEDLDDLCDDLVRASLENAGYHLRRGEWRRRVTKAMKAQEREERIAHLTQCAKEGNVSALGELRDQEPDVYRNLLKRYGDMQRNLESHWANKIGGGQDLIIRAGVFENAEEMRASLCGPNLSPLEAVLVHSIVVTSLQASYADIFDATSGEQKEYLEKVRDRINKRLCRSIKTLAQVRKLIGPSVEVKLSQKVSVSKTGKGTKSRTVRKLTKNVTI